MMEHIKRLFIGLCCLIAICIAVAIIFTGQMAYEWLHLHYQYEMQWTLGILAALAGTYALGGFMLHAWRVDENAKKSKERK